MQIRQATIEDFTTLESLINQAYRSGQGWTHEAHIVQGPRIHQGHIQAQFHLPYSVFLLAERHGQILGCIYAQQQADKPEWVEIGTYAVQPGLQGQGLGKALLNAAELYAQQHWQCRGACIWVVAGQNALLGFYRRRGYVENQQRLPYPLDAGVGTPVLGNIELVGLEKGLF